MRGNVELVISFSLNKFIKRNGAGGMSKDHDYYRLKPYLDILSSTQHCIASHEPPVARTIIGKETSGNMATAVYLGVRTAQALSGVGNRLMFSSVELAVHAAATAVQAIRSSGGEKNLAENPLVKEDLEAMDIEAKLRTVHALVLTIQKQRGRSPTQEEPALVEHEPVDESDVIGVSLAQVKEVLESITATVNALNEELDAHEQRWFSSWRTPDTRHHLISLKAKVVILDKRVDMLLKLRAFVGDSAPPAPAVPSTFASYPYLTNGYSNKF
jgi:hypothetical protein